MAPTIIFAMLIIAGFLTGIRLMQSPRTALWGNRLGALSMLVAVAWTLIVACQGSIGWVLIYIAAGAAAGLVLGQAVRMIHMPQTVALLNGFGGAASALVACAAMSGHGGGGSEMLFRATAGLAAAVGAVTFSGSIIAVLKLQGLAFRKSVRIKWHGGILCVGALLAVVLILFNTALSGLQAVRLVPFIVLVGLLAGFVMALRIGGADMPILVSLLNSLSGVAATVAGLAVQDIILAGTGALVGVAGLILTGIMCRAMNRGLLSVLAGFAPETQAKCRIEGDRSVSATGNVFDTAKETGKKFDPESAGRDATKVLPEILRSARKVIIVPGYGMAVAQAQMEVRNLVNALEEQGAEVKFAIHPVAGRMPGHMNVLLAEVGIDYEKLVDIDSINPQFTSAVLAIIVGACDVVNPAANSVRDTPISGMPILDVEKAGNIVVCNMDDKPGYSGVENLLYKLSHVVPLWGDASQTVPQLTAMIKRSSIAVRH